MKKGLAFVIFTLAVSIFLTGGEPRIYADTIILKDGRRIEGLILAEQQDCYIVKIKIGTTKVEKAMIEKIDRLSSEENFLNFGNQYLDSKNYDSALEQYKKALDINPDYQPAKDAVAKVEKIKKEIEEQKRAEMEKKKKEFEEKKAAAEKGFGFRLDIANDQLKIISVNADSGAEAAGLKQNDQIIQINNQLTKGESLEKIINLLVKGESTSYHLLAQREVELTRKKIDYQKHTFVGVGIFLDVAGNDLIVNSVIVGEPADLAGLRPRDKVISINGKPTAGVSVNDAAELIGGTELSNVTLVIQRSVDIERK
jgi:C-terminal processing protease CtpA/Prc